MTHSFYLGLILMFRYDDSLVRIFKYGRYKNLVEVVE